MFPRDGINEKTEDKTMARSKRTSPALDAAKERANALATVDKTMDFGNGVSLPALNAANTALEKQLGDYNQMLSQLDDILNAVEQAEAGVTDLASRLLGGVRTKYGADSSQYEMAGGKRKSEIKRGARASKKVTPASK